jgi:endonuclease YncB( thermonuclease family)
MPLFSIAGTYRVIGASPDGDSVRFYPDDRSAFSRAGLAVRLNAGAGAQLRLDGIDALETHYTPVKGRHVWRQPRSLAGAAADELLRFIGFSGVVRANDGTVTRATPESRPGHVLTRFADTYGRCVCFAYSGQLEGQPPPSAPSAPVQAPVPTVHLDVPTMRRSVNYQLLAEGLVYPTFYSKLYVDLRQDMQREAESARARGAGVWAEDATLPGFTLHSREQLEGELVVLPKIFRRLAAYLDLDETGSASLAGFAAFLAQQNDQLFTVPDGHATGLDTVVAVRGQQMQLTVPPERIVFLEK